MEKNILLDPDLIPDISGKNDRASFLDGVPLFAYIKKGINRTWKLKGLIKNEDTAICLIIERAGV